MEDYVINWDVHSHYNDDGIVLFYLFVGLFRFTRCFVGRLCDLQTRYQILVLFTSIVEVWLIILIR